MRVKSPHTKSGTLGQDEIGPIDNYTCTDEGLFPHEDCDYFVTCWNKQPVLWRCTEDMLYDLRYNGCDYAENVDCGDRRRPPGVSPTRTPPTTSTTTDPSITTTTPVTTPAPNGTFDCPEDGAFPHEERCEYYWNCWEGVAYLMHCQLDYLFDLTYDGCNFPEMVDCGNRTRPIDASTVNTSPRPTTSQQTTVSGATNPPTFQCPEPEGLFPDPEDCGAFYSCLENEPTHKLCPDGLHFNPVTKDCDWPGDAGCANRFLGLFA